MDLLYVIHDELLLSIHYVNISLFNREFSDVEPVPGTVSGCSHLVYPSSKVQFHMEGVESA